LAQNKQHTDEFETCIEQVVKQGHGKDSAFAICTATFKRAGKPIYIGEAETQKLHLFSESVKIEGHKVSGVAIHPKRIFHPEEGVTHVYLKEELEKAAPTLVGKPFGIDHRFLLPPPNVITNAWYDLGQDGVAFEGFVDDEIAEQVSNRTFKGLSIELDWLRPGGRVEYTNGIAPRNFELTSVHLLKSFPPGDKDAFIKVWNGIMEQLVSGPPLPLDQRVEAIERRIEELSGQVAVLSGKLDVLIGAGYSRMPDKGALQEPPKQSEGADAVVLRKQVLDLEASLAESERRIRVLNEKHLGFCRSVEAVIPRASVWGAWRPGSKLMVQQLLRLLRESSVQGHDVSHGGDRRG
jgi:hypothetical protein